MKASKYFKKQDQKSNRYDSIYNNVLMILTDSVTHSHTPNLEMLWHLKNLVQSCYKWSSWKAHHDGQEIDICEDILKY